MHSSCIDTHSSARLPLVKSPQEVGFRNTVDRLCRRRLKRLDGVELMSFELHFHSRKQEKVMWSLSESKTFFTLVT